MDPYVQKPLLRALERQGTQLIHTKDCASHQLPICTCGALNRWAAEEGKKPHVRTRSRT